jgi:phenylpyruvate tautomerase PptA (4-oxalocrotonate tautomerase family)
MAQFKIYGRIEHLRRVHRELGELIHGAAVRTLQLPPDKCFQRFIALEDWQLVAPPDRSERYLIIEVVLFSGRSVATRKALIAALMSDLTEGLALSPTDVEITLFESPRENWGIRGQHGDALPLGYKVEI